MKTALVKTWHTAVFWLSINAINSLFCFCTMWEPGKIGLVRPWPWLWWGGFLAGTTATLVFVLLWYAELRDIK